MYYVYPKYTCHGAFIEGGHRDVDTVQGTLLLGKAFLVGYLMESSIRVQEESTTEGGSRVPDCPRTHVSSYMYNILLLIIHVSVTTSMNSTSGALILVVRT